MLPTWLRAHVWWKVMAEKQAISNDTAAKKVSSSKAQAKKRTLSAFHRCMEFSKNFRRALSVPFACLGTRNSIQKSVELLKCKFLSAESPSFNAQLGFGIRFW